MARRSQCSDAGDNPLDSNYLPPHYREEYRLAIDALVEEDVDGYYKFLQCVDVVDFLSPAEIDYIQSSIQLPKQSSQLPEQRYLDTGGDGSSDTYWPLHSDLDAPGLDLGWPQTHHFIGPTEVTTLVNPAAPDMPSIKDQARRLIKNAHMVIAVVMDMFTDVDIFADILNAAMRNVAVYLLLDEANVDHFINMVNNCRVNLQSIQCLRVRTVTGIRYHCRSGKSFKGQMLDRFILTDCRAVLSGNYSFMWSYEKLHRCMAHLFLGQLVSTFDEEFRILFAQSEPLIIENMEGMTVLPKQPLPGLERPMLRDIRKYRMDAGQDERNRQPYEENMDWRMMQLKRKDSFHGPMDIYNRYPSPQSRLDPQTRLEPQFDQGPPRMMESMAHKRHSFAEGAGPGRYNLPHQQQGLPEVEQPGRPYYRGQQHLHPRDEPDYGGYGQMDKFWNPDFHQDEPYPEPGYPRDIETHEGYDPVLNYLSTTRNVEIDQSSDKLIPGPDLPYSTTHPRRHNIGQAYACQTSPTPSTEKKFMLEPGSDRKDPTVKKGLRNWRISSYLSAYDSSGEQEGLPMQGQTMDPFDDMPHPIQQPTPPPPAAVELAVPKIPNVREFKVPALPRASQLPGFAKTTPRDLTKRFPDEIPQVTPPVLVIPEPKVITPTPSESSSTTDGEKQEEPEQREPIASTLRREDSFRRKYNAGAVQRSSRLRSSLIFSSLDQNTSQDYAEQEDDKTKAENEPTKLPFVSQVLAQRRSGVREPFEWRSYIKSTDNAKTEEDGGKQDEKDSERKLESLKGSQEVVAKSKEVTKEKEAAKSPELATQVDKALPKPPQIEQTIPEQQHPLPVQHPTQSFLADPFVDMNDPDQRFLFFKQLAAQRRAAKAAEEAKSKQETAAKDKKDEEKKEEQPKKDVGTTIDKSKEESKKTDAKTLDLSGKMDKVKSGDQKVSTATKSCEKIETKIVTKDKEELNKVEKTQQGGVSTTIQKPKEESQKTKLSDVSSKIPEVDGGVNKNTTSTQSSETKIATDLDKIEAKHSKVSESKEKITQEKQTPHKMDHPESAEANVAGAPANIEKSTEESQPAPATDSTSKDPQLKTSRSVPDLAKTGVSDLLSSLPSARIYERSLSQEANKDATPKSRLWSPSLHRRELLKPFGDKQKSVSTVSEVSEEASQTTADTASGASKSQEISSANSGDEMGTKQNLDAKAAASATESKESAKVKSQFLPTVSENTPPQQDVKATSPSQAVSTTDTSKKPPVLPTIPETSSSIPEKTMLKQPEQEKCSDKQVNISVKPLQPEKSAEKSNVIDQGITKEACPKEMAESTAKVEKLASTTIEKPTKETTSSGKDSTKETGQLGSTEKTCAVTQEEVELTGESLVTASNSKDHEKSSSTLPSDKTEQEGPVTLSIDEAKQKCPIASTEDFSQLESHSNTSSPASYATALEFIDSDMLSPARTGPSHLFKSGNAESSTSDMSDFETPNSYISMSPTPFTADIDDTIEDNVSVAETVIETASRRISETTEERKATTRTQESQNGLLKDSAQSELPQERLSSENLDAATAKSEATTQLSTSKEVSGSDLATQDDSAKTSEAGKLGVKTVSSTKSEKETASKTQSATKESSVCPVSSRVEQQIKMSEKDNITTESSTKDTSVLGNKVCEANKESISTDLKTQDLVSQSDTNAQLSEEKMVSPASPATSGETKDTKMEDKTVEIPTKDVSKSTEPGKDGISTDPTVSTMNSEAENNSRTNQSSTSPATSAAKDAKTEAKVSEISSNDSVASKEPTSEGSKRDTKTIKVSSRFLTEPIPPKKTQASAVTPKVTEEEKNIGKTAENKEKSQSTDETRIESIMEMFKEAKEKKGQSLEASESETKLAAANTNTEKAQTTDIKTKEASAASENVVSEKDSKSESKTGVSSSSSPTKQSETRPAKQEGKVATVAGEISTKDINESIEVCNKDKETETKTEGSSGKSQGDQSSSLATSEDTQALDKGSKIIKGSSVDAQSEQKSKDTNVNTKEPTQEDQAKQNAIPEPAKAIETAPPNAQPKQQPKPLQSRYLSSTANVISSSNLRDDTKILLEQISAQSQSRNESTKEAPVTDDEKEDEADKNAQRKKENELRSSLGQQKSSQDREKVLQRIQTMRKDRKVFSRFEL